MFSIAIDGPAGAGKSTIAKEVAKRLGFIYVDTGAMYRSMALYFLRNGIAASDEEKIGEACKDIDVSLAYENGEQQVLLNGENVNAFIRTEEVSMMTSDTSKYKKVREKLLDLQRNLAKTQNVIMDGRDIGTTVFPDAELKIFVTATPEIRAQRRYDELKAKGQEASFDEILENVKQRDYIDQNREVSPLRKADDALLLDNTDMTIPQQKEWLQEQFNKIVKR